MAPERREHGTETAQKRARAAFKMVVVFAALATTATVTMTGQQVAPIANAYARNHPCENASPLAP